MIQSFIVLIFNASILVYLFKSNGATGERLNLSELEDKFRTFHLKLLVGFFLLLPANIAVLTYLLDLLSNIGFNSQPLPEFVIKPNIGTWLVISMMLTLATSTSLVFLIVRTTKKKQSSEYWVYYNSKYGFNAFGLLKYLSIAIVIASTFLIVSQQNTYTNFYEDSVTINKPLELQERVYEYSDIVGITHFLKTIAPNGNIVDKPHYGIEFRDGFTWRTNDDLRTPNISDPKIFTWLLEQTNLSLNEVEIDEK
jgi:hypothetical protein